MQVFLNFVSPLKLLIYYYYRPWHNSCRNWNEAPAYQRLNKW